jgi:4-oxalocrotonate tautomerase
LIVPIVIVEQSPRTINEKRKLAAGITEAFMAAYSVAPEQVQVFIHESQPRELGEGGQARERRPSSD